MAANVVDPYASIAQLYEAEHRHWLHDVEMYRALAARAGGAVLELGCGSGRVLLALAEANHEAHGIDVSKPLLKIAAEKAKNRGLTIVLTQNDMRGFSSSKNYGFVFCALDTLLHLPQAEDLSATVESAFQVLRPGGLFAIDLVNPNPDFLALRDGVVRRQSSFIGPSKTNVTHFVSWDIDPTTQTINSNHFYDWIGSGNQVHRCTASMRLRYRTRDEIEETLKATGFTSPELYGSTQLDAFEPDSERMIFVSARPPG